MTEEDSLRPGIYACDKCEWSGPYPRDTGRCPLCGVGLDIGNWQCFAAPEREFPRGMQRDAAVCAIVSTAVAYVDQLCAFNALEHPAVHRERLRLSEAVDAYHHSVQTG